MAAIRSRTITPNSYARPTVTIKPRPQVTITPRPDVEITPRPEIRTTTVEEPPLPKIDVILFTLPPSCVIGDRCEGEIVLKNNTEGTLDGSINIGMQGAIPVPPTTYAIPAGETVTVVFEIPTEGLTIIGTYVLELEMYIGTEAVETQSGKLEIIPIPGYDVTFASDPDTAEIVVAEV